MALGIACAGTALLEATHLIQPVTLWNVNKICNALYGWMWAVVQKPPRVPDCFQLSDSLTCSDCLMFVYDLHFCFSKDLDHTGRPTICFSRWCQILLTLSGASTTKPMNQTPLIRPIPTLVLFAGKELFWSKTEWLKLWQTVQKTSKRSPEFTWMLRQWDFFICRHLLERRSVWRSSVTSSRKSLETSMKMSWSKDPSIQVSYSPRWICYHGDSPICPTRSWHVLELFSRMASWMLAAWEIF